ncbi:MAM1 protein [Sporothrix schenckii 1099-18]|uniref:MAM1 protein n=1 Tax=Sporothrix schenckii 1099-18 TaxID=1397361 RepID=A0A0F2M799_SPOSC|nr:MAM1 protein [Sporothrix schenckii 1099-18]KJR84710.1 MAM1 protein [Sporothrix schenckii 1099-18]
MARTKAPSHLLSLVESDSDDDLGVFRGKTTVDAAKAKAAATNTKAASASIRDMPPAKRGRPPATAAATSKVTKAAQKTAATRRAGERRGAAAKPTTVARSQRVLADKTNEMAVEPAEPTTAAPAKARGRPGRKAAAPAVTDVVASEVDMEREAEAEDAPAVPKKRGRGRPKVTTNENDDQQAAKPAKWGRRSVASTVDGDVSTATDGDETADMDENTAATNTELTDTMEIEPTEPASVDASSVFQSPQRHSRPHAPAPSYARHARGASTTTGGSDDASVRRRLGELTKKYDALEARYRDLKEIGVKEAERNFDRLKKQGDDRAKASNDLIASLKAELASFRELTKDGAKVRRDWEASEARAADLQAQVGELKKALDDAKAASKTLSTKLAAARTAAEMPALPAGMAVPGSAIKASSKASSAPANARAAVEAMQANSQMAQLKEDLYGDLTGLLVRSAVRQGGREMYDCIQTGRNGSLHFKLCIDEDDAGDGAAGDDSAQFVYTPQLDDRRDAALIEQLPDYLVEEISFPRLQAAKFYKRVMQALTEDQ